MIVHHEIINGLKFRFAFNCDEAYEAFLRNRKDVIELGLEGAMRKWHNDEARERRKWGLEVKDSYDGR